MASAQILWLFLGIAFSIQEVDAVLPSSPQEGLQRYSDHCLGNPPSQDTCCNRMGLNVEADAIISEYISRYPTHHRAALFEVEDPEGPSGWVPVNSTLDQWIQVDFGSPRTITGILLQGRSTSHWAPNTNSWVKSFRVLFSNGKEVFTSTPELEGTYDHDTVSRRMFDQPIRARYFRICPLTWNNHIALRFDLLGCRK